MKAKDKAIIWMTTKENMAFNLGRKIALKARDEEVLKAIEKCAWDETGKGEFLLDVNKLKKELGYDGNG